MILHHRLQLTRTGGTIEADDGARGKLAHDDIVGTQAEEHTWPGHDRIGGRFERLTEGVDDHTGLVGAQEGESLLRDHLQHFIRDLRRLGRGVERTDEWRELLDHLTEVVGDGASGMLRFMNDELFEPLGIRSATPKFDTSGTFIGSSFLLATPQDFARFGLLFLRGGNWDGQQILPPGWVDYARSPTFNDGVDAYGAQWWLRADKPDWFYCGGYDGQRILCVPEKDLVIVRCGRTPITHMGYVLERLYGIAELFADS